MCEVKNMKEKTKKEAFFTRISKYTDISLKTSGGFRIEISSDKNGFKTITVYDVKKIEKFTDDCVILNTEKEKMFFSGERLECLAYASGAVEIIGKTKLFKFMNSEDDSNV